MWTVETVSHVDPEGLDWVRNCCAFRGEVSDGKSECGLACGLGSTGCAVL